MCRSACNVNIIIRLALVVSKVNSITNLSKEGKSFSRSDMILESQEWSNNVIAKINDEFDCDSKNDAIRKRSQHLFSRELDFADHVITYGFTIMKVTGLQTINLARTISSKQMKGGSHLTCTQTKNVTCNLCYRSIAD